MARKLRIAVSVFFGALTLLLCVLWVRSNSWRDILRVPDVGSQGLTLASLEGYIAVSPYALQAASMLDSIPAPGHPYDFPMQFSANQDAVIFPHWAPALAFALCAALPWVIVPWKKESTRFSLRTMLIATTLVAVVLGLAVWAGR